MGSISDIDTQNRVVRMRRVISRYTERLSGCIDRRRLSQAYQQPRRSDRLYMYRGLLQDACCACFRGSYGGDDRYMRKGGIGRSMVVYGFGGKVWEPLLPMEFDNAVSETLVRCASAGDFVVKGDWVDKQGQIMQYAMEGVSASPLELRPSLVGFGNGVFDFSDVDNIEYHSFDEALPIVSCLGYDYDPLASCPLWCSFLSQMLASVDIVKLQKYLGLGVVGRKMLAHRVEDTLWLVGSGANGKSTILNIVRAVYGSDKISECSLSQLLDRNPDGRMRALYSIEGKVFNICDEVDMRDISRGSDAFKKLSSGEPQNVRGIGKDIHVAYDIPFLVFSMNSIPSNRNMDGAFRRRIVRVDFRSTVREDDMDTGLQEKLMSELPGIRNWMVEGYRMLMRDGFRFSHVNDDTMMEDNEQYFDLFLRREGIRPSAFAGHNEHMQLVQFAFLYDRYLEFCTRSLYPAAGERSVSNDLKRLGYRSQRKAQGIFYEVFSDEPLEYAVQT